MQGYSELKINTNVVDSLLLTLAHLLRLELLTQVDMVNANLFQILTKLLVKDEPVGNHMRIREVSSIIVTLLSKKTQFTPNLKAQLSENYHDGVSIVTIFLDYLIKMRYQISDATLIGSLKALAYSCQDDVLVCQQILSKDSSLYELFDYLNYPHKGIKIQVSSILSSLLHFSEGNRSIISTSPEN